MTHRILRYILFFRQRSRQNGKVIPTDFNKSAFSNASSGMSEKRSHPYIKNHRGVNIVDGLDAALVSSSVAMGIGGASLLITVVAAPIVFALEVASLGAGFSKLLVNLLAAANQLRRRNKIKFVFCRKQVEHLSRLH